MFTDVITDLKKGVLPADLVVLKKRFDIAMTKKNAVLKLPYHFWSSDSKIHPLTEQLLWVALLLGESEIFSQVKIVLVQELSERLNVSQSAEGLLDSHVQDHLQEIVEKFTRFAPDNDFRQVLVGLTECSFSNSRQATPRM